MSNLPPSPEFPDDWELYATPPDPLEEDFSEPDPFIQKGASLKEAVPIGFDVARKPGLSGEPEWELYAPTGELLGVFGSEEEVRGFDFANAKWGLNALTTEQFIKQRGKSFSSQMFEMERGEKTEKFRISDLSRSLEETQRGIETDIGDLEQMALSGVSTTKDRLRDAQDLFTLSVREIAGSARTLSGSSSNALAAIIGGAYRKEAEPFISSGYRPGDKNLLLERNLSTQDVQTLFQTSKAGSAFQRDVFEKFKNVPIPYLGYQPPETSFRNPYEEQITQRALDQPLDLSPAVRNMVSSLGPARAEAIASGKRMTPGERVRLKYSTDVEAVMAFPQVKTVRDAQDLLMSSMVPGYMSFAAERERKGYGDFLEEFQQAATGGLEAVRHFDPFQVGATSGEPNDIIRQYYAAPYLLKKGAKSVVDASRINQEGTKAAQAANIYLPTKPPDPATSTEDLGNTDQPSLEDDYTPDIGDLGFYVSRPGGWIEELRGQIPKEGLPLDLYSKTGRLLGPQTGRLVPSLEGVRQIEESTFLPDYSKKVGKDTFATRTIMKAPENKQQVSLFREDIDPLMSILEAKTSELKGRNLLARRAINIASREPKMSLEDIHQLGTLAEGTAAIEEPRGKQFAESEPEDFEYNPPVRIDVPREPVYRLARPGHRSGTGNRPRLKFDPTGGIERPVVPKRSIPSIDLTSLEGRSLEEAFLDAEADILETDFMRPRNPQGYYDEPGKTGTFTRVGTPEGREVGNVTPIQRYSLYDAIAEYDISEKGRFTREGYKPGILDIDTPSAEPETAEEYWEKIISGKAPIITQKGKHYVTRPEGISPEVKKRYLEFAREGSQPLDLMFSPEERFSLSGGGYGYKGFTDIEGNKTIRKLGYGFAVGYPFEEYDPDEFWREQYTQEQIDYARSIFEGPSMLRKLQVSNAGFLDNPDPLMETIGFQYALEDQQKLFQGRMKAMRGETEKLGKILYDEFGDPQDPRTPEGMIQREAIERERTIETFTPSTGFESKFGQRLTSGIESARFMDLYAGDDPASRKAAFGRFRGISLQIGKAFPETLNPLYTEELSKVSPVSSGQEAVLHRVSQVGYALRELGRSYSDERMPEVANRFLSALQQGRIDLGNIPLPGGGKFGVPKIDPSQYGELSSLSQRFLKPIDIIKRIGLKAPEDEGWFPVKAGQVVPPGSETKPGYFRPKNTAEVLYGNAIRGKQYIQKHFPEFEERFLGTGKSTIDKYNAWLNDELSDFDRGRFEFAWDRVKAQHNDPFLQGTGESVWAKWVKSIGRWKNYGTDPSSTGKEEAQVVLGKGGQEVARVPAGEGGPSSVSISPTEAATIQNEAALSGLDVMGVEHSQPPGVRGLSEEDIESGVLSAREVLSKSPESVGEHPYGDVKGHYQGDPRNVTRSAIASRESIPAQERPPALPAGGGGDDDGGGPPEPELPPFMDEDPQEEPEPVPQRQTVTNPYTLREPFREPARRLAEGKRTIVRAPTGLGKTSLIQSAFESHDLGIIVEPGLDVAEDVANRMQATFYESARSAGLSEFQRGEVAYIPGYQGEVNPNAPPQVREKQQRELELYERGNERLNKLIRERYDVRMDPRTNKEVVGARKEGAGPIGIVTTAGKAGNIGNVREGGFQRTLATMTQGARTFLAIDEAHTLFNPEQFLGRKIPEAFRTLGEETSFIATSGTLTEEQIFELQGSFGVSEEDTFRITETAADVTSRFGATRERFLEQDIKQDLSATGDDPAMVFGRVEHANKLSKRFEGGLRYHKSGGIPEEEFAQSKNKLLGGLERGDVMFSTTAASTGIDRPELGHAVSINPYDITTLRQQRGRVERPQREGDRYGGQFTIRADPGIYTRRAQKLEKTAEILSNPNNLARLYESARAAIESGELSPNWKEALGQVQERIATGLGKLGADPLQASKVTSYLQEFDGGLIGPDIGEDASFRLRAFESGDRQQILERFARGKIGSSQRIGHQIGIQERIKEDFGSIVSEQRAMGSTFEQLKNLPPEIAGSIIDRGLIPAHEQGGSEGALQFSKMELPEKLAQEFAQAITGATEKLNAVKQSGGDVNKAQIEYTQALTEARRFISASPEAQRLAQEGGAQAARVGQAYGSPQMSGLGAAIYSGAGGPGAPPPPDDPFVDSVGFQPDPNKRREGYSRMMRHPAAGVLYGAYMARRMFSAIAAPVLQGAERAGAEENVYAGLGLLGDFDQSYATLGAGLPARRAIGESFENRAALQSFGGVLETPYVMSGIPGGDALARIGAQTRVAGGIAATGAEVGIGLQMSGYFMNQMGVHAKDTGMKAAGLALGRAGGFLTSGAIAVGGALAGGSVLHEPLRGPMAGMFNTLTGENVVPQQRGYFDEAYRGIVGAGANLAGILTTDNLEGGFGRRLGSRLVGVGDAITQFGSALIPGANAVANEYYRERFAPFRDRLPGTLQNFVDAEPEDFANQRGIAEQIGQNIGVDPTSLVAPVTTLALSLGYDTTQEGVQGDYARRSIRNQFEGFFKAGKRGLGLGESQYTQLFEQLRGQFGYRAGSQEAGELFKQLSGEITPFAMENIESEASRMSTLASQIAPYTGYRGAADLVRAGGLTTPAQAQTLGGMLNTVQQYGGSIDQMQFMQTPAGAFGMGTQQDQLAQLSGQYTPARLSQLQRGFGNPLLGMGFDPNQFAGLMGGLGQYFQDYTPNQVELSSRVLGGDLRAASFLSYDQPELLQNLGMDVAGSRLFDQSGNQIFQTSGADFIRMGQSQARSGLGAAQNYFGGGTGGLSQAAGQLFPNVQNPEMIQSFMSGGLRGAQDFARSRLLDTQSAGVGIGLAQIEAQEQFLQNLWPLQDRQRGMAFQQAMTNFGFQRQRLDLSNQFGIEREDIGQRQMNLNQGYQNYQLGMAGQQMYAGREFQLRMNQYSDTLRGLGFEFGMEDINEAIRFSSGRERRQLVRQRERMTLTHNIQEQQVEEGRDFQSEQFAREEEQHQKRVEYIGELQGLEREQFDLSKRQREEFYQLDSEQLKKNREEYIKQHELQTKIIQLSRDHQLEMLELQKQQLGVQAEAIQIQRDLEEVQRKSFQAWNDIEGSLQNINAFAPERIFEAFLQMVKGFGNVSPATLDAIENMIDSISSVNPAQANAVSNALKYGFG